MGTETFHEFEGFAASIENVDCSVMLRSAEQNTWVVTSSNLDQIGIQVGISGSGNIVEGRGNGDGFYFYVPIASSHEYLVNGQTIPSHGLAILPPSSDFCVVTMASHCCVAIFVPTTKFSTTVDSASQSTGSSFSIDLLSPSKPLTQKLQRLAFKALELSDIEGFELSRSARKLEQELIWTLTPLIRKSHNSDLKRMGRPVLPRKQVIDRAQFFLSKDIRRPTSVQELASVCDVSERTLRNMFKEYFQMSPVRYLQLRQLHSVRRDLRNGNHKETTCASVFMNHGIWDFGRFAGKYKQLFGEFPVETLRQPKHARIRFASKHNET